MRSGAVDKGAPRLVMRGCIGGLTTRDGSGKVAELAVSHELHACRVLRMEPSEHLPGEASRAGHTGDREWGAMV